MMLAIIKRTFADYAWLLGDCKDPPPLVGDVVYRFTLAAIAYIVGASTAAWYTL